MIKTSIIVPVYNVEKYLKECLESLINQTQKELEIIAIDDGSTDRSLEILREYEAKDERIVVYTQKNSGQGIARNVGLKVARGKYIYFVDSDDYIAPETTNVCYEIAEKNGLDALLFDANVFVEEVSNDDFKPDSFDRDGIVEVGKIYRGRDYLFRYMDTYPDTTSPGAHYCLKEFIDKYSLLFIQPKYEDVAWRFKLMLCASKVMYMPYKFYNYRYRPNSTMTSKVDYTKCSDLIDVLLQMIEDANMYGELRGEVEKEYIKMRIAALPGRCKIADLKKSEVFIIEKTEHLIDRFATDFLDNSNTSDLQFLCFIYGELEEVFPKAAFTCKKEEILKVQEKIIYKELVKRLSPLPLKDVSIKIGIYGTGIHTDKLLKWYKHLLGEINAQIIYIDTRKESFSDRYNGSYIYNIKDIDNLDLDGIIISSRLYEEEMVNTVRAYYGDKYKIYCLYEQDKKPIF